MEGGVLLLFDWKKPHMNRPIHLALEEAGRVLSSSK